MSKDDDGIYKVDTVPPPQGEDDAYNAPTRVGVMASAIVGELLAQGERDAAEAKAHPENDVKTTPPPAKAPEPVATDDDEESSGPVSSPLAIPSAPPSEAPPKPEPAKAVARREPAAEEAPPSKLPLVTILVVAAAIALYLLMR